MGPAQFYGHLGNYRSPHSKNSKQGVCAGTALVLHRCVVISSCPHPRMVSTVILPVTDMRKSVNREVKE